MIYATRELLSDMIYIVWATMRYAYADLPKTGEQYDYLDYTLTYLRLFDDNVIPDDKVIEILVIARLYNAMLLKAIANGVTVWHNHLLDLELESECVVKFITRIETAYIR